MANAKVPCVSLPVLAALKINDTSQRQVLNNRLSLGVACVYAHGCTHLEKVEINSNQRNIKIFLSSCHSKQNILCWSRCSLYLKNKKQQKKTLELWVFKIHKKKAKGLVGKCTKKKTFLLLNILDVTQHVHILIPVSGWEYFNLYLIPVRMRSSHHLEGGLG